MVFRDRREAGWLLARRLVHLAGLKPLVIALPPGGVPVALEVARTLHCDVDVVLCCELADHGSAGTSLGAVMETGEWLLRPSREARPGARPVVYQETLERLRLEAERRGRACRAGRLPIPVRDRVAIVVSDGIVGQLAPVVVLRATRRLGPRRLVLAAPLISEDRLPSLAAEADEVVQVDTVPGGYPIAFWYETPIRISDQEIAELLAPPGAGDCRAPP